MPSANGRPLTLWFAILGYFIQWFGDSMDGSLARWRKIERPKYGYFIDHSVDGLVILLIMAGIGWSPYVRMDVALFALAGYLLLSIHAYFRRRVLGELKLSYMFGGPTELRFVLIGLTLAMMWLGPERNWFETLVRVRPVRRRRRSPAQRAVHQADLGDGKAAGPDGAGQGGVNLD